MLPAAIVEVGYQEVLPLESLAAELTHERSIVAVYCIQVPPEPPSRIPPGEGFQADGTWFAMLHWEGGDFMWIILQFSMGCSVGYYYLGTLFELYFSNQFP